MAWGVDFQTNIFLSHQDYQGNEYQVQDAINELKHDIEIGKQHVLMYCSCTPKDISTTDEENILFSINNDVNDLLLSLKEDTIKLYQLELYKEYLEELNKKNESKN